MKSWSKPGAGSVCVSAVLLAVWSGGKAQAQSYRMPSSSAGNLASNRPRNVLNDVNRVGFQAGLGQRRAPVRTVAPLRATPSRQTGISRGYAQSASYYSGGSGPSPGFGSSFVRRRSGTRSYGIADLGATASRRRLPRGSFNFNEVPMSRHAVSLETNDLPFSAGSALAGADSVTVSSGGTRQQEAEGAPAFPGGDVAPLAEEAALDEVLRRRISGRREMLLNKARAEFQEGNYQAAFGQFVLADSIEGTGQKNPKRLVVLSSIAAGNFSRGALELQKLLAEDPAALFSDPYHDVGWLYTDPELLKHQLTELQSLCTRDNGDPAPWMLYAYALWLAGDAEGAERTAQGIIDLAPDRSLVAFAEQLVAGMRGRPKPASEKDRPFRFIDRRDLGPSGGPTVPAPSGADQRG